VSLSGAPAASSASGVIVVAGFGSDGVSLLATFTGGATWTTVYHRHGDSGAIDLGFTTSSQGVGILSEGQRGSLLMTFDGGHSWRPVPAAGQGA
jgi:photosystem II stability/assembly factor-like uncharacterized protein